MLPAQVLLTQTAESLIERLRTKYGPLIFHQSGGCCNGSSPMCLAEGDLLLGEADHYLGTIASAPFYMSKAQFAYWKHTQLIVDAVPGRGGMFSLENGEGVRFLIRSRVFTAERSKRRAWQR